MAGKETVLVTGAGGFIGGWVAEILHLQGSVRVRAGIRSWNGAARLARFPVDIVACDVMDASQIARAITGCRCVIHCAYGSRETTVQGTRNMLDAALLSGVQRFVHLSTCDVYGYASREVDESTPVQDAGTEYSASKIEAEGLCWNYHRKGLPVTIIRPAVVYGPFGRTWTVELAGRLQSGQWGLLKGYGEGICNLVYVADLVSGILLAASNPSAIGEAFNLRGPEVITWNEYWQRFDSALSLPELRFRDVPTATWRANLMEPVRALAKMGVRRFGSILRVASRRSRPLRRLLESSEQRIKTTPRPIELSLYDRRAHYVATKAQRLLGYAPRYDVNTGLELTIRWLEHVGLVERGPGRNGCA